MDTKADIDLTNGNCYASRIQELKFKSHEERDARELEGIGGYWSEQQQFTAPKINSSLVGWLIEMYFELGDVREALVGWLIEMYFELGDVREDGGRHGIMELF
jgi:hypothetical protein